MGTSLFSGIWREIRKKIHQKFAEKMAIFDEKIEIRERCKGVHCVDLGESFPTSIYLQKSASIRPRTSPSKFGGKFNSLFTSLFICETLKNSLGNHASTRLSLSA